MERVKIDHDAQCIYVYPLGSDYDRSNIYRNHIKVIPDHRWDQDHRRWVIPFKEDVYRKILESFGRQNDTQNRNEQFEDDKHSEPRNGKQHNSKNIRIVSCPSCKQRIRITFPLRGTAVKCSKCKGTFEVYLDNDGNLYVIGEKRNKENSDSSSNINTIDECFAVLGLASGATSKDIKCAYKMRMKEYHPDKVSHLGEKLKSVANIEAKKINTAYSMLREAGYVNNS